MLSRTADNLFWMARYMERAEYLALLIDATQRLTALPRTYGGDENEWESALASAGALERFRANYDAVDDWSVIQFLVFDPANPSSIRNCLESARANARAVRTALTAEMWQSINTGWLESRKFDVHVGDSRFDREELRRFLDLVRKTALDIDGAASRTMLRNDAYWFTRLGLYLERADSTARILDVKYHLLLPEAEGVGSSLDYFQWAAILRGVSALSSYHWVYREEVKPWLVADLLILRPEMPRSLISCYQNIVRYLDALGRAYGRQGAAQRQARAILSRLEHTTLRELFQKGLHESVTTFIEDNNKLGSVVVEQYLIQ